MGEVVGRKKKAVAAGALALALGAGLGLGAVAWGSEGAAPEDVAPEGAARPGEAWVSSVGEKLDERVGACARSYRAEVQQALSVYRRALEAEGRKAGEGKGEQEADAGEGARPADGASQAGESRSAGESAGEAPDGNAAVASGESSQVDGHRRSQSSSEGDASAKEGEKAAPKASDPDTASSGELSTAGGSAASEGARPEGGTGSDSGSGATLAPGTLMVGGTVIPYRDVRGGTTPSSGGGLWLGSDAVDDGSWGYFVGHNPGSFAPVRSLSSGDAVTVCDRSGAQRTYSVKDAFQVEETATWKTIASRVTGYGESVVLQTCAGDGMNVIVVAA